MQIILEMSVDKLITVVIPTFKRTEKLKRTLGSLCGGDMSLLDIIVIDDDPQMSAAAIVQQFGEGRYFAKRGLQRGLSISRNIGIDLSVGKYIVFIDDDDFFYPGAMDIFTAAMHPQVSFYYSDFTYLRNTGEVNVDQSNVIHHKLMVGNTIPVGSFMIEKAAIVSQFDTMMRSHEDWEFLLKNVRWENSLYLSQKTVIIDKTEITEDSMQIRKKDMFWLDYLSIYSKHPSPELAEARAKVLATYGVNVPADLLSFDSKH
jgi:glycosyltransferase involved in cell wall biosynthesis